MKKLKFLFILAAIFALAGCTNDVGKEPGEPENSTDSTPPATVTDLTAKCTATGTVKLIWTNPTDEDFAKVVITYGNDGKVEVLKTATPNNEAIVSGLTDGTEYTFTVKAYDNAGNVSSGVDVKCKLGKSYTLVVNSNGGLEGYSLQEQGEVVKETWMEITSGNLIINGTEIAKTSEVVAVPKGTVAKINMTSNDAKGQLFTSSRKIKLSPFVISQYPVTRGLFIAVMGDYYNYIKNKQAITNGTEDENPINYVNWFDAIVFCNKLSIACDLTPVYSYDFGNGKMTDPDDWFADTVNLSIEVPKPDKLENTWNWNKKVVINLKANGYRLPTETEWEFCARGGDPNALEDWGYTYSGSNEKLDVWCKASSRIAKGTNIVGCMNKANKLELYDMSGNVLEWCDDNNEFSSKLDDNIYIDSEGYVKDPIYVSTEDDSSAHRQRGGGWESFAADCEVGNRNHSISYLTYSNFGFRVCRSTEVDSN